jgi:hypothetical protein
MIRRKKPIKRSPIKKKPYKIKQVSTKQASKNRKYSEERKEFLKNEENQICKAKWVCNGDETTDVHHTKGRGLYLLDTLTWIGVCRACHQKIEENPEEAKERGLSQSRLNKS